MCVCAVLCMWRNIQISSAVFTTHKIWKMFSFAREQNSLLLNLLRSNGRRDELWQREEECKVRAAESGERKQKATKWRRQSVIETVRKDRFPSLIRASSRRRRAVKWMTKSARHCQTIRDVLIRRWYKGNKRSTNVESVYFSFRKNCISRHCPDPKKKKLFSWHKCEQMSSIKMIK